MSGRGALMVAAAWALVDLAWIVFRAELDLALAVALLVVFAALCGLIVMALVVDIAVLWLENRSDEN